MNRGSASTRPDLREFRLTHCAECEQPFPARVTDERVSEEWGDAADDEIAYVCGRCADDFDGTTLNAR